MNLLSTARSRRVTRRRIEALIPRTTPDHRLAKRLARYVGSPAETLSTAALRRASGRPERIGAPLAQRILLTWVTNPA